MESPLLLIDVPNLAHRMYHALKSTDFTQRVIFGVLRDLYNLAELHNTTRFAFCFDSDTSRRKEFYPPYKSKREQGPEKKRIKRDIEKLRLMILPNLGYERLWLFDGYEADDAIAWACESLKGPKIVISNDGDLLQLLGIVQVTIWNPLRKVSMTRDDLVREHNMGPIEWVKMKAIIGCDSDDIAGVKGVGAISAVRWMKGELPQDSIYRKRIESEEGKVIVRRNFRLTRLPYPDFHVDARRELWELDGGEGKPDPQKWDCEVSRLGIRNLTGKCPAGGFAACPEE